MNSEFMPAWLLQLQNDFSVEEVGAKAFNLGQLRRLHFNVPDACVIPTYHAVKREFRSVDDYLNAIDNIGRNLTKIIPSSHGWAVRSSATIEDLQEGSLAGRFETLYIKTPSELRSAVLKVWESGGVEGIGPDLMGVIVQKLINADFAGVAFSRDPVNTDISTVVEMCEGKGSRLVDGKVTPWRVRMADERYKLPEGFAEKTLTEIDNGVRKLARELGHAVDVEWAVHMGKLHWLQVRPMTESHAPEFKVPDRQVKQLSGLWVRMQHSYAPQMPLIVSMNPGGYFNSAQWKSQLVNQFHFIMMKPERPLPISKSSYNRILDKWDEDESCFAGLFTTKLDMDLEHLTDEQLWHELLDRIELNRALFVKYLDPEFIHIRKDTRLSVENYIEKAVNTEESITPVLNTLLADLGTKTEKKQKHLVALANLKDEYTDKDICKSRQWSSFIDLYGFESGSSQLFYIPTLKESPERLLQLINRIRLNHRIPKLTNDWREQAKMVEQQLTRDEAVDFRNALTCLRRCMLRTEDDDSVLQQGTAQVRYAILECGRRLYAKGLLAHADDVFLLNKNELKGALCEELSSISVLQDIVESRRGQFNYNRQLNPPSMIVNGRPMNPKSRSDNAILTGDAASAGIASGTTVILNDPFSNIAESFPDDCVVVAPVITPSLAYSLVNCKAIVTEIGGFASHGAIVAREMGIPAVVGVSGARERMIEGMHVTVDGEKGEVYLS